MPDTRRGCGTCRWGVRQPAYSTLVECDRDIKVDAEGWRIFAYYELRVLDDACEHYEYAAEQHVGGIDYAETVPSGLDAYCLNACTGPHAVCDVCKPGQ